MKRNQKCEKKSKQKVQERKHFKIRRWNAEGEGDGELGAHHNNDRYGP
jgi:hypothetical protein